MAQGGVNPHTAADLLRQAMAQNNARHTSDEQMRENLLSGAPTPSGVETPTPDFQDKRMPGIMPSYFGQQLYGAVNGAELWERKTLVTCVWSQRNIQ